MKEPERAIEPPQRYCVVDRQPIPAKRFVHGSNTCSPECAKQDKRERRDWKASRDCRLCGRKARRPRLAEQAGSAREGVRQAHNAGNGPLAVGETLTNSSPLGQEGIAVAMADCVR